MKKFLFLFAALVGFQLSVSADEKDSLIVNLTGNQRTAILQSDIKDIHFSFPGDEDRDAGEKGITQVIVTTARNYRFPLSELENMEVAPPKLCPNDNHPHMIDLGLPSGTKWACCNVGASAPEEYGGHYAWGETSEKSYFGPNTYQFANEDNYGWVYDSRLGKTYSYINIGSDIAGTQYDVARVKWGAPWRMPTHVQQMELFDNCTSEWTIQDGVNGFKLTGPNGGTIFLPAAGGRNHDEPDYAGSWGYYWSSTLYEDEGSLYTYKAHYMIFYTWYGVWSNDDSRDFGFSVRPVQ